MVSSDRKLANAVGAKSARACDNCVRKRARWYCAADDAFLCQSCDSSVHSANSLARRHERVRIKTTPFMPSWHQGFTRKPRTPRQKKHFSNSPLLVPEISGEENSHEENEEQLLYRVPIFDPFVAELCTSSEVQNSIQHTEFKPVPGFSHVHGFLPSEMDLAEFAADVESLLGKGLEDKSFDMEGLGILDCDDENEKTQRLKIEVGEDLNNQVDDEFLGFGREANFELNFDYDSPLTGEENDVKVQNLETNKISNFGDLDKDKKLFLRLDYEGVISAWDDHKSPWTTGERPVLNSDDCWLDCMGTCGTMHVHGGETTMMYGRAAAIGDGGREARVSRYREKRRTRLFSKKIRYEVRKLNAEKRPRMKGRFVKRANFVAPASAFAFA